MANKVEKNYSERIWLNRASIIYAITIIIAVLIIYLSIESVLTEREEGKDAFSKQLSAMADLATDSIARSLGGVRDTLRLISHMPPLREHSTEGIWQPLAIEGKTKTIHFLEEMRWKAEQFDQLSEVMVKHLNFAWDLSMAFVRRIHYSLCTFGIIERLLGSFSESANLNNVSSPGETSPGFFDRWFLELKPLRISKTPWQFLFDTVTALCDFVRKSSTFVDLAITSGKPTIADLDEARRLLTASLNDKDLIRSVTIKNLDGQDLVGATEIGEPIGFLSGWIGQTAKAARAFYPGPVKFDESLGRPLWQAAVPIRDRDWIPIGILSTQVDLGFLSELAVKTKFSPVSYLFIVDENGIIIGHPKTSMVVNQVNVSISNPAVGEVLSGKDGVREIRILGSTYLVAYRQLKSLDRATLPAWGVLFISPISEVFSWTGKVVINAVLIAALSLYVLFYVSTIILAAVEEEIEG